ncbi:hypothetical protein FHG64_06625 [Antarcticibacterium flavum]|uniref:Pectinacetylesterase n=1 Tax=Antarcticibacterium flavum TaxID=2058175 RepID=A0A5B7X0R1_9FLAO|nr:MULTISPECIES: pectin acetylesterase-family hydrolase [Antarcticibacterium]MCM4161503.1 hypothetical protein [Antarcticibacterium sp. W02-3]QCY69106.1 hypothetical protein FHG64_06625 [Antarcticibacterium flavum]
MKKLLILTGIILLSIHATGQTPAETEENNYTNLSQEGTLPGIARLSEGWNILYPGGETLCAQGSEYKFFAKATNSNKLLVYLHGGGGCWDAETCDPERETYTHASQVEPQRHPENLNGIFDPEHPENPFVGYSMVVLPVCTGDSYLGARDVTYVIEKENGKPREFTVYHRGQTNTMAVMNWIYDNFESPQEIFVAGSSAGALATPFYASLLAQQYPEARVVGLSDDAGSFGREASAGSDPTKWGVPEVLQKHPGWEEFEGNAGIDQLFLFAARSAPNLELYQVDHAHDAVQKYYLELTGTGEDVQKLIQTNRETIRSQQPQFRSYTAGGFQHTILTRDHFYKYQEDGNRLSDWVASIAAGEQVKSVDCAEDCFKPGLIFTEQDLQIIDRTLALISNENSWNPSGERGPCPSRADSQSLRCAAVMAATEVTGKAPTGMKDVPPGLLELIFTITALQPDKYGGSPLIAYNNDPETNQEDMIATLEKVKETIKQGLEKQR